MTMPDSRASHTADDLASTEPPSPQVKCTICSKSIRRDETEYELEFFAPLQGGTATFRLHGRCFEMWEELQAGPWATRTRREPRMADA